jgi:serine/threonine protein kinase/cytochrome c-type biogenesis protein CcmH/NrfG
VRDTRVGAGGVTVEPVKLSGLTDSPAGITETPAKCRVCGATTRLGNGLCLSCTLREALDEDYEGSRESFQAGLVQSEVKDTHWRVGNYDILEEIGRGGMGVIYRARQRHSRRIVALKRMVSYHADSRETRERFRREAEAAASLDHPNILPIYEISQGEDGLPFFSMKYATGGSLQKAGPALRNEPRESVRLMARIARAAQFAHEHGVLHRDLKPGNILLDGRGEPFVTDFGLAKWLDTNTNLTRTLTIFGTPGYIAPEQAKGPTAKLTPAADVYSLGAILFDLLTGRPPFLGEHALAVLQQASEKPAPKLRSLAPALDRDLETICARCLEREPQARYRSAGDLAIDLERWLEGRPIMARRVSPPVRLWRWAKRNRTSAVAMAAAFCSAVAAAYLFFSHAAQPPLAPSKNSIAVLLFENLSKGTADAYLAAGIQDEILTRLSKIAKLKVISRTSTRQYQSKPENIRDIARQLGVASVLEGSVRKVANTVRVNVQLIRAADDEHIWANSFDRTLNDVFAVEREIAAQVAEQLDAKLSGEEQKAVARRPTKSIAAYEAYLRGRSLQTSRTSEAEWPQIIAAYVDAIRLDPDFALAWAHLAVARSHCYGQNAENNSPAIIREAADRALILQPELGEAWLAQGAYRYRVLLDYPGALQAYEEAHKRLPNDSIVLMEMAYVERRLNRWDSAVAHLKQAVSLDPRNLDIYHGLGATLMEMRRFAEAHAVMDQALRFNPDDEGLLNTNGFIYLFDGRLDAAAGVFAQISPHSTNYYIMDNRAQLYAYQRRFDDAVAQMQAFLAYHAKPGGPEEFEAKAQMARLGFYQEWAGHKDEAAVTFTRAIEANASASFRMDSSNRGAVRCLALAYAGLGRKAEAVDVAQRAITAYSSDLGYNGVEELILAMIQARFGEADNAVATLEHLLQVPGVELTCDNLRVNPIWDPLRKDQSFQKLCEEPNK